VLHVGLKINADTVAVGFTGPAVQWLIRRADPFLAPEAGAHSVAGATVVCIGLEIDAGSTTVGQTSGTLCRAGAATATAIAGLTRGTGKAARPAVPCVAPEIGAVAFGALRHVWRLTAIGPSWRAPTASSSTDEPTDPGADLSAGAAVVTISRQIDAHAVAACQATQACA
jgi:hypothetical protein